METYYRHRRMPFSHSRVSAPQLLLADLHKNADYITDVQQIQPLGDHSYQVPRATDTTVLYEDTKHPTDRMPHTVVVTTASVEDSAAVAQLSQHSDDMITSDTSAAADQACALLLQKYLRLPQTLHQSRQGWRYS